MNLSNASRYLVIAIFLMGGALIVRIQAQAIVGKNGMAKHDYKNKKRLTQSFAKLEISASEFGSLFAKFSGNKVIVDDSSRELKFSFAITASRSEPVSFDEIVEVMRTAAMRENARFLLRGDGHSYILKQKALDLKTGVSIPSEPIYSDSNPLPENGDQIVTYVMAINKVNPEKAKKLIIKSRIVNAEYQAIAIVPERSELVITDKVSAIREMIKFQKTFDK